MKLFLALILCISCASWAQGVVLGMDANGPDEATLMGYRWRKDSVYNQHFKKSGFQVLDLAPATRQKVGNALMQNSNVTHISGCGHGSGTTYTGYGQSSIISTYDNQMLNLFKGKHVHLLSCQTAQMLGRTLVNSGALSFAGYHPNFSFTYQSAYEFFEADGMIDLEFARGKDAVQAKQTAINKFNEKIESLSSKDPSAIRLLIQDRDGLRCWNRSMTIEQAQQECCNCVRLPQTLANHYLVARDMVTGKFMTQSEALRSGNRLLSFRDMSEQEFTDLVIAAYEREANDMKILILSKGGFTKEQIIEEIRNNSEIGKFFVSTEQYFLQEFTRPWWEEIVKVTTNTKGSARIEGKFTSPTDLLREVQFRWRTDGSITNIQANVVVNGKQMFNSKAANAEPYNIFEKIVVGENVYSVELQDCPVSSEIEVIFANCGCGRQ